ncbi:hypothetical protein Tcan_18922 [Toxocara canis]|uniref:Uncharacterized protein n=1 Tax=Toxocara canis TaxID=6265 RepID=A0A0B2UPF6_TOXCA|nr:hypothetical protein Tcan_18922 [Toxocara canis]
MVHVMVELVTYDSVFVAYDNGVQAQIQNDLYFSFNDHGAPHISYSTLTTSTSQAIRSIFTALHKLIPAANAVYCDVQPPGAECRPGGPENSE